MVAGFLLIVQARGASFVPDQYYPNYRIDTQRETLLGLIEDLEAATSVGTGVSRDKFRELNIVFDDIFDYFPSSPSNNVIYKQCLLTTQELSSQVTSNGYAIFKDRCFVPVGEIVKEVQSKYTVKAKIDAKPKT